MKIQTFFEKLADDPYGRYACCAFRSIDGVIFVRQESGTFVDGVEDPNDFPVSVMLEEGDARYHALEPYWIMGAVIEDDVLLTHIAFDEHRTVRQAYWNSNYRQKWCESIAGDRVHVQVRGGQPPILKPHTRKLRNRYGMIRDTLLTCMEPNIYERARTLSGSVPTKEDLDLLMPVREWWDWAWAYAITDAAKRLTDCNNKIASSLTAVSFDNLTNLDSKLTDIREKVSASDFEAAKSLFDPLKEQVSKLADLIHNAEHKISTASFGISVAKIPYQLYRLLDRLDKKITYLFDDEWYSAMAIHTKSEESLLEGFDSLTELFDKIGLPISAPYGVQVCTENIGQLAVLNDTIREVILTSPHDEVYSEESKEPETLLV